MGYELKIMCGNSNPELAEEIAMNLGVSLCRSKVGRFSDGEIQIEIQENVRGADVFVVQSTCPGSENSVNDNIMELLVVLDALKRSSSKRVTAVLPYYGYARQDRKPAPRVPISSKLIADLLTAAGAHRVLCVDLHAAQIQGFFNIPVDHLFAASVLIEHIRTRTFADHDFRVVSPDAGGTERARYVAMKLNKSLAIIDKRRERANECSVMHIVGDVRDRECLLIDDMIDTAGSLCNAAEALVANGAKRVIGCAVHPVLSGPAATRIAACDALEEIIVTNTVPISEGKTAKMGKKLTIVSVGRMLSEAIRRIHNEESVSILFS